MSSDPNKNLFRACRLGDLEAAQEALDNGAHPDCVIDHQCPLSIAIQRRHPLIMQLLLKRGAHIGSNLESVYDDPSDLADGMSPVAYALQDVEMLTVLLAESDRYPDLGREAAKNEDGSRGQRYIDMIKRSEQGRVYKVLSLVYGSPAEREILKMQSEEIIAKAGGRIPHGPSANN